MLGHFRPDFLVWSNSRCSLFNDRRLKRAFAYCMESRQIPGATDAQDPFWRAANSLHIGCMEIVWRRPPARDIKEFPNQRTTCPPHHDLTKRLLRLIKVYRCLEPFETVFVGPYEWRTISSLRMGRGRVNASRFIIFQGQVQTSLHDGRRSKSRLIAYLSQHESGH